MSVMTDFIIYFDPTSTSGLDGYMNYKMSGGSGFGGGSGGGFSKWILVILFVLWVIGKLSGC